MAKTYNTRIKNKRDTSANWTTHNPVILNGEMILVDTAEGELRAKVGDGVKTYTQLPFTDEALKTLINEKADKTHTHSEYAKSSHNHDDRYYTESEIDAKLSALPVSGHTHEIDDVNGLQDALDGKADSSDLDNYYTKPQIDEYEFIATSDIDEICGTQYEIAANSEVKF